jgi:hypothetical protein
MLGTASFPAWRITQPVREESNSFVKNCGNGVDVGSRVAVGIGVLVTGTDVGRGVLVGKREAEGVGVAGWQAVSRMRHPIRSNFFMALIAACFIKKQTFPIVLSTGQLRL